MSRGKQRKDVTEWRELSKRRLVLVDELKEVAPQGTAGPFAKQVEELVRLISSPNSAPEIAGDKVNTVLEMVIDMIRIASESHLSSSSELIVAAVDNGEELARATEEYNQRLAQLRAEFDAAQRDHEELLATLERVRAERDNALMANDQRAAAAEARAEKLLQENERLQKKYNDAKRELDRAYEAFDAVEEAEAEEKRLKKKRSQKK